MENPIAISMLNDFIFCPISIYFHKLYDGIENVIFQNSFQLNGTKFHKSIDENTYSAPFTIKNIEVYSSQYNLIGKIDIYNKKTETLIERKKCITTIYDGYVFQLYAQYFAMTEMGYSVKYLQIHSIDSNKTYPIALPMDNIEMFSKFKKLLNDIKEFTIDNFIQPNKKKCCMCIYETFCDRGIN